MNYTAAVFQPLAFAIAFAASLTLTVGIGCWFIDRRNRRLDAEDDARDRLARKVGEMPDEVRESILSMRSRGLNYTEIERHVEANFERQRIANGRAVNRLLADARRRGVLP